MPATTHPVLRPEMKDSATPRPPSGPSTVRPDACAWRALALAALLWPTALSSQSEPATPTPPGEQRPPTSVGVDYTYTHLDGDLDPWHLASLSVGRRTSLGSVIGRVNYAERFGSSGVQIEADAYPRVAPGAYGYLNAGYAPSGVFPAWRFGGELFTTLGGGWEASAGARHLRFDSSQVTLYTGSVGKYVGNYWLSLRPYIRPKDGGLSASASLTARRYFAEASDYVGARVGYGSTPGDRLTSQELERTQAFSASLHGARRLRGDVYGTWSVGYDREELAPDRFRNRAEVSAGVSMDL